MPAHRPVASPAGDRCARARRGWRVELRREGGGQVGRPFSAELLDQRRKRAGCSAHLRLQRPATTSSRTRGATRSHPPRAPIVVGTACWVSVRAAAGSARCCWQVRERGGRLVARSSTTSVAARRATVISAESTMSWLVAPRWIQAAASGSRLRTSARDQRDNRVAVGDGIAREVSEVDLVRAMARRPRPPNRPQDRIEGAAPTPTGARE